MGAVKNSKNAEGVEKSSGYPSNCIFTFLSVYTVWEVQMWIQNNQPTKNAWQSQDTDPCEGLHRVSENPPTTRAAAHFV